MSQVSPADRTTFVEFQARNRRATWKLTAACALVVGAGGLLAAFGFIVNVALVLFAVTFVPALVFFLLGFLALLTPGTGVLSDALFWVGGALLGSIAGTVLPWLGDHPVLLWGAALLLPIGAWLAVRSVWLAAGVGETLLEMGARAAAPGDLEERQLVNVVEEMAIAAGIPAPRVRLLDGAVANAAAAGWDPAESYVVVGRRVLDEFDRDATQGLLAHLVGSIGNGDLRGAAQIHSLLYVLELMIVVVLAPFARFSRRIARAWLAFPFGAGGHGEARAERARVLIGLLAEHRALMQASDGKPGSGSAATTSAAWAASWSSRARPSSRSSCSPRRRPASCSSSRARRWRCSGGAAATWPTRRPFSSRATPPASTGPSPGSPSAGRSSPAVSRWPTCSSSVPRPPRAASSNVGSRRWPAGSRSARRRGRGGPRAPRPRARGSTPLRKRPAWAASSCGARQALAPARTRPAATPSGSARGS